MLNKKIAVAIAVFVAIICLAEARPDDGPHDMADALRMLQELDRFYTQAARPRYVFIVICTEFQRNPVIRPVSMYFTGLITGFLWNSD